MKWNKECDENVLRCFMVKKNSTPYLVIKKLLFIFSVENERTSKLACVMYRQLWKQAQTHGRTLRSCK